MVLVRHGVDTATSKHGRRGGLAQKIAEYFLLFIGVLCLF